MIIRYVDYLLGMFSNPMLDDLCNCLEPVLRGDLIVFEVTNSALPPLSVVSVNMVESGASASIPTITPSEVSASQVAGATDSITMTPGITVIPVSADHIVSSQDLVKK